MRRTAPRALAVALAAALLVALSLGQGGAAQASVTAPIQDLLASTLATVSSSTKVTVKVHGTTLAAAKSAVAATGMKPLTDYEAIDVAVARGTRDQIQAAATNAGVTYLEGDRKLQFFLDTSHQATRGGEAVATLKGADGTALNGSGVSVAVIDTGVDPMHPFFKEPGGGSAVVKNMKNVCGPLPAPYSTCIQEFGALDTDTLSVGGHGTHVNGIVGGRPTKLSSGKIVQGAAPGAMLVSISVGGISVLGSELAYEWVLNNHANPCGDGSCPPIKSINNSYGTVGDFDPNDASAKFQKLLAEQGVVSVWAQGNEGGDGSDNQSNPNAQDPTPGILGVASYYDLDTGTRDGKVSDYSSRGDKNRPETWADVSAPGENITSSCRPYLTICTALGGGPENGPGLLDIGTFNTISGTSMAAPHISGIVAQLFQAKPTATAGEIEDALKSTAYKYTDGAPYQQVGAYTTSFDKGTGLVDVVAAAKKQG
jgi:subtilisin family serine protease